MEGSERSTRNGTPPSVLGKRMRNDSESLATDDTPTKLFRCGDCDKSYSRVDHLARHVRVHTQERPYACQTCGKSFARADLLKRHAVGHVNDNSKVKANGKSINRQNRVSQACEACAELHLKCENEKPCTRCKTKGLFCQHASGITEAEAVAHDLLSLSQHPISRDFQRSHNEDHPAIEALPFSPSISAAPPEQILDQTPGERQSGLHVRFADAPLSTPVDNSLNNMPFFTPQVDLDNTPVVLDTNISGSEDPNYYFDGSELKDFLHDIMSMDALPGHSSGLRSGTWTPRGVFDIGADNNLELNDIDFGFLDSYNQHNPFSQTYTPETVNTAQSSLASDVVSEPPLGAEHLQKSSVWKFRPVSRDNRDANLSLPLSETVKRFHVERRLTLEPLSYNTRDQLLTLITSAGQDRPPIMSFPSTELLDSLLQYFVASTSAPIYLVHGPTFYPSRARVELVGAMVATGACLASDASLRKLGYVMQEALRVQIIQVIERNNASSRDMELIQAAVMCIKIGFWSGNSRKMEIAESHLQPWATMMRRSGWFGRKYEHIVPLPSDDGSSLESKWRSWLALEKRKRMTFFLAQHDAQCSQITFINPNVSYAELSLPLPHPTSLWQASSAQAWKTAYLSVPDRVQPPSTLDLLQNVDRYVTDFDTFDIEVATHALLSATWGLVHEYRQQSSITSTPNQWNNGTLLLSSRLTELKRLLECLRMGLAFASPLTSLYLQILSMNLHTSLEEINLFAGVEGHEEAKRVYPNLRTWTRTNGARQAVWHAGQVVRFAKSIPGLRDFAAVGVYQAALALWTFGVIGNSFDDTPSGETLALNSLDDGPGLRFIALNKGRAGLDFKGDGQVALLSDPAAVMGGLMDLLRQSHTERTGSRPPLVDNLLELMGGLRSAVSGP